MKVINIITTEEVIYIHENAKKEEGNIISTTYNKKNENNKIIKKILKK